MFFVLVPRTEPRTMPPPSRGSRVHRDCFLIAVSTCVESAAGLSDAAWLTGEVDAPALSPALSPAPPQATSSNAGTSASIAYDTARGVEVWGVMDCVPAVVGSDDGGQAPGLALPPVRCVRDQVRTDGRQRKRIMLAADRQPRPGPVPPLRRPSPWRSRPRPPHWSRRRRWWYWRPPRCEVPPGVITGGLTTAHPPRRSSTGNPPGRGHPDCPCRQDITHRADQKACGPSGPPELTLVVPNPYGNRSRIGAPGWVSIPLFNPASMPRLLYPWG